MKRSKIDLHDRWRRDGRWPEVSRFMETVRAECKAKGMKKAEATAAAWEAAEEAFPLEEPSEPPAEPETAEEPAGESPATEPEPPAPRGRVSGLDRIPEAWGELPPTARLQRDLEWVNANRLWIVRETGSGGFVVDLGKAYEPAPSRSALGWLDLAIRNPAKFMDLAAKKLGEEDNGEEEMEREERMQLDEIKRILGQFCRKGKLVEQPIEAGSNSVSNLARESRPQA